MAYIRHKSSYILSTGYTKKTWIYPGFGVGVFEDVAFIVDGILITHLVSQFHSNFKGSKVCNSKF